MFRGSMGEFPERLLQFFIDDVIGPPGVGDLLALRFGLALVSCTSKLIHRIECGELLAVLLCKALTAQLIDFVSVVIEGSDDGHIPELGSVELGTAQPTTSNPGLDQLDVIICYD